MRFLRLLEPRVRAPETRAQAIVDQLVIVEWDDAAFDLDAPPHVSRLLTVGWIVAEDSSHISLACERDRAGEYARGFTTIPRTCVVDIRHIES